METAAIWKSEFIECKCPNCSHTHYVHENDLVEDNIGTGAVCVECGNILYLDTYVIGK